MVFQISLYMFLHIYLAHRWSWCHAGSSIYSYIGILWYCRLTSMLMSYVYVGLLLASALTMHDKLEWACPLQGPMWRLMMKKFKILKKFQASLKFSSEPPTKTLFFFFVGNSGGQDWKFQAIAWNFQARFKLSGVIRANRFARFARITRFSRIGNSSDSCESAWRTIKIGVSIANDSRESIRANRVANRPCH